MPNEDRFLAEIIPSINAPTFEDVILQIARVEPYAKWCHIDVTDGVFSAHSTWRDPNDLPRIDTKLNVEVHLMVADPDGVIDDWLVFPVRRVIAHAEAIKNFTLMLEKCRDREIELGVAINPETEWETLRPYMGMASILQALAVHPGPSGQPMAENTFDKIANIRKDCKKCIIEVDGGINPETAQKSIDAGADILVVGSFLSDAENIGKSIEELRSPNTADNDYLISEYYG